MFLYDFRAHSNRRVIRWCPCVTSGLTVTEEWLVDVPVWLQGSQWQESDSLMSLCDFRAHSVCGTHCILLQWTSVPREASATRVTECKGTINCRSRLTWHSSFRHTQWENKTFSGHVASRASRSWTTRGNTARVQHIACTDSYNCTLRIISCVNCEVAIHSATHDISLQDSPGN